MRTETENPRERNSVKLEWAEQSSRQLERGIFKILVSSLFTFPSNSLFIKYVERAT